MVIPRFDSLPPILVAAAQKRARLARSTNGGFTHLSRDLRAVVRETTEKIICQWTTAVRNRPSPPSINPRNQAGILRATIDFQAVSGTTLPIPLEEDSPLPLAGADRATGEKLGF